MQDMATTLMKGAATVGKIFSSEITYSESVSYSYIEETEDGVFKVVNPKIYTQTEGVYYLAFNVRGVETSFVHDDIKIEIKEKKNFISKVINYLEAFVAFIIATAVICVGSQAFPFYLSPLIVFVLGGFATYLWFNNNKGIYFLSIVYLLMLMIIAKLALMFIQNLIYLKKKHKTPQFFSQKQQMYREYVH